jgi:3-keto-disaccharide hydrolase
MPRVLPSRAGFLTLACAALLGAAALHSSRVTAQTNGLNTLSAEEKAAGFKLLFDGKSLAGWRSFKSETPPAGWKAIDGLLTLETGGGDLVTADQYGDFDLRLEWRISPKGNGGVMFRVTPDGPYTWSTGPEMQILDNAGHNDGKKPITSAGSNFAVNEPIKDVTKPVGEWNDARLLVNGAHVEHWLNGVKLLEYELWSPDWEARVKASKFATMPGYGRAKRGFIAIQDHGNPVWFRNIRIRPLS